MTNIRKTAAGSPPILDIIFNPSTPLPTFIIISVISAISRVWRHIFADVTGYPVVCPKQDVEANMGDVILAGIGTGILSYEKVKEWQVLDEKIMPDEKNHEKYNEYFELYHSVYRNLKTDMKKLTKLAE